MTAERARRRRGFTMVEMLVGLTIASIVLAAVTATFSLTVRQQRAQRLRLSLAREGSVLNAVLTQELRVAGLGNPTGRVAPGTSGDTPVHMLVTQRRAIAFIADIPRPDANFSTFGILHDRPAGANHLMWHTDNNGTCAPDTSGTTCSTATTSLLFPGEAGCAAAGSVGDRTCPWGSKRLRAAEFFQVVGGNGTFLRTRAPATLSLVQTTNVDAGGMLAFPVDTAKPFPAEWPNTVRGDAPVDIRGQGWVTTMDRVFYRNDTTNRTIERRQCWGDFNIQHASWPPRNTVTSASTLAVGSSFNPLAVPGTECTPWEVIARDVESVTFSYFADDGSSMGFPGHGDVREDVARVNWVIRLARNSDGQRVFHDVVGAVRLRNI